MMEEASGQATEQVEPTEEQQSAIDRALSYANLAEGLFKKEEGKIELLKIGKTVVEGYRNDETSRDEWMTRNKEYMKLATQVMEKKSFPWENAANVKYPLLTTASLQFASRAYPSLIPSFDVVKAKVIGNDQDGQMTELANKLSTHMSYVVNYEVDDWEENMDKLCYVLPIVGTMFKKVYYEDYNKKFCIDLLSPRDVVVNYYTKKLCKATRITEIQWYTPNEILEFQNKGYFLDYGKDEVFGPGTPKLEEGKSFTEGKTTGMSPPPPDDDTPRKFLIQYTRLDLDEDGYKEPYIVTVDEETEKVVRIAANFYMDGVKYIEDDPKKGVACIEPAEWFVKFDFMPNPDGGFYGIGFGILLGGLNEMVNTITNQLIDAGTLSNLQAGFIGRGLRDNKQKMKGFQPGEWKWVNNPGKDLKENIFPLPVREPSTTLFQLLGTLVQSGKEVASVAEIFTGKMPGQNTPAATTMATIEQGLKVFTSIYKRIYRGMGKEFQLLFMLLKKYAPTDPVNIVAEVNGVKNDYDVSRFDYQKALVQIVPAADQNMVSETQKLLKIQGLYELVQLGTINKGEMTRQALIYQGQENIAKLMELPPPAPPMEIQIEQLKQQAADKDRQLEAVKIMSENQKRQSEIVLNMAKAKQLGDEAGVLMLEMQLEKEKAAMEIQMKIMELIFKREEHQMDMQHEQEKHQMDMQVSQTEAAMNLQMTKQLNEQKVKESKELGETKVQQAKEMGDHKIEHTKEMGKTKIETQKKQAAAKEKMKPSAK